MYVFWYMLAQWYRDSHMYILCGLKSQCFEIQIDQNRAETCVGISVSDENLNVDRCPNVCLSKQDFGSLPMFGVTSRKVCPGIY